MYCGNLILLSMCSTRLLVSAWECMVRNGVGVLVAQLLRVLDEWGIPNCIAL